MSRTVTVQSPTIEMLEAVVAYIESDEGKRNYAQDDDANGFTDAVVSWVMGDLMWVCEMSGLSLIQGGWHPVYGPDLLDAKDEARKTLRLTADEFAWWDDADRPVAEIISEVRGLRAAVDALAA